MKLWPIVICVAACKGHDKPAPPPTPTPTVVADAKPPGPEKGDVEKVLQCLDAANAGTLDVASCYTPNAIVDTPLSRADTPELIARFATLDRTAFPDAKQAAQLVVADRASVAVISLVTATQAAPLETWLGTIPTQGKAVGFLIGRRIDLEAGKISHEVQYYDLDTLASQLGVKTTATLAPVVQPTGKPPEIHIPTGAADEGDLLETARTLCDKLDDTTNDNFADWYGDHFTFTDSDLPAPLDATQTKTIVTAARQGLKAQPHAVGFAVAGDTASAFLEMTIQQDGAVAELGLGEPTKIKQPEWFLPTLIFAKFASHANRMGKLSAVWMFHRDRPMPDRFVEVGKLAIKESVPEGNALREDTAQGTVELIGPYAHCRTVVDSKFVGKATVSLSIDVNGKLMNPVTVTGVAPKLATCIQDALKDQLFPKSAITVNAAFAIMFKKAVPIGPIHPLEDSFASRFARQPRATGY
jgi:predicted ester cyclase